MTVEFNPKRVANLLKVIVNQHCEDGFEWYKDITDERPSILDMNEAIKILENSQVKTMTINDNQGK